MNELADAWQAWWAREPVQLSILGLDLVWWGRIGKLLQFIAGLTIVAELIGAERLRNFGQSLHRVLTYHGVRQLVVRAAQWSITLVRSATSQRKDVEQRFAELNHPWFEWVNLICAIPGAYLFMKWLASPGCFSHVLSFIVGLSLSFMFAAPWITAALIITTSAIGFLIDVLFIEPVAWLLDRDYLDKWVKVVALLLFIVGFHFDLLSS